MKKAIIGGVVAAGLGSAAIVTAQDAPPPQMPGQMDVSRVEAGSYVTDPAHTLVQWEVSHFGFNPYYGLFGDVEGTLQLDPDDLSATRLAVTIPITSLAVVSEGLREHMLRGGKDGEGPDFFGPTPADARFVATRVERTGDTSATIRGDLTMLGVTQPIVIEAEFTGAGANPMSDAQTIGFTGTTTITRSDFGMDYAVPMISDEVDLTISAAFEKQ